MTSRGSHNQLFANAPWLTAQGIDFALYPIDPAVRQALSPDDAQFRSGCTLLGSMSHAGRAEAGVFLLGLLRLYPDNYARLTSIAEALLWFPTEATVAAFASELRRVKGSSSTRAYLRRIIDTLEKFPAQLVDQQIEELASDPKVGTRFRQRLRSMTLRYLDE